MARDLNHAEIKAYFQDIGCTVIDLADAAERLRLPGLPDLLVGGLHRGLMIPYAALVEVKREGENLRPDQVRFFEAWPGPIEIARTMDDVLKIFGIENDR